uniref:SP-RING-type domain-containing protein n=1 Tax=Strongyloides venezuelensis TaxID=75913 RepID=A0A0K0FM28_STRVS
MSGFDFQRYKKLIQFTLDDKDIKELLKKVQQPTCPVPTINRRKLLTLLENPSKRSTIIDLIDKHQVKKQNGNSEEISEVLLPLSLNNDLSINMKKLFFYRNFTPLTNWEVVSCKNMQNIQSIINQSKVMKFYIPESIKSKIQENGDGNICKNAILLRSVKMNPKQDEYYDSYPYYLRLLTKRKDYTNLFPREIIKRADNIKERVNYPTILNELVLDETISNKENSNVSITLSYNSKSMPDSDYCFQIVASEEVPDDEVIDEILKRPKRSIKQFKKELKKYLVYNDDLKIEKVRVTLRSSVLIGPIGIPFRGRNCTHLIPDDLKSYIKINRIKEDWMCKICNTSCTPDEIIIDQFYVDLLTQNPNSSIVEIYENGKFEVIDEIEPDHHDDILIDESPVKSKRPRSKRK